MDQINTVVEIALKLVVIVAVVGHMLGRLYRLLKKRKEMIVAMLRQTAIAGVMYSCYYQEKNKKERKEIIKKFLSSKRALYRHNKLPGYIVTKLESIPLWTWITLPWNRTWWDLAVDSQQPEDNSKK